MSEANRRNSARVPVNDEFQVIEADIHEYVRDLSRGGAFLRGDALLPIGTQVRLRFTLLMDDIEFVEGVGEVVHHGDPEDPGMGIRFIDLTAESRALLDRACPEEAP